MDDVNFDTHLVVKQLAASGFDDGKSEALVKVIGYVTQRINAATKRELEGLATKRELEGLATKEDLKGLVTKVELQEALKPFATKEDLKDLVTKDELQEALRPFATKEDLKALAAKVDLAACASKEDMRKLRETAMTVNDLKLTEQRITIRFGTMLMAGIAALAAIMKLI